MRETVLGETPLTSATMPSVTFEGGVRADLVLFMRGIALSVRGECKGRLREVGQRYRDGVMSGASAGALVRARIDKTA